MFYVLDSPIKREMIGNSNIIFQVADVRPREEEIPMATDAKNHIV